VGIAALTLSMFPGAVPTSSQALVSISIVDDPRPVEQWGFAPANRRVPVGSWVTWSNDGYDAHSVTSVDGSFDSSVLNPSEGFSWYFDQDGTYEYVCALHDWMVGSVIVGSGIAPQPPPEASEE
jgi:plastocyanin